MEQLVGILVVVVVVLILGTWLVNTFGVNITMGLIVGVVGITIAIAGHG